MSVQKQFTMSPTPWSVSIDELLTGLKTDTQVGLTTDEATRRLQQIGPNRIPEPAPDPLWKRYWEQLTGDAVVRLLLIGGAASLLLGDYLEGIAIIVMLNIMAGFGLWQEGRATDAARALRSADTPLKLVVRDGKRQECLIDELVPGDIVYLPTGAIAPADGRVVANVNAEKDTSKLTGESFPVKVEMAPLPGRTVVNEQYNMIHRGDAVIAGNLTMVVTATGGQTEIGKIAETLAQKDADENRTPLDEQLDTLGNAMAKIFIWMAGIVIGLGLVREFYGLSQRATPLSFLAGVRIVEDAFINAVALIIAAIPEGLPAVLTITLAIAGQVLAKRKALVRRPKAVEGGGSMTVLLTDKTGTLTANEMTVTHLYLNGQVMETQRIDPAITQDPTVARALRIAHFCNNNSDPTESALLRLGERMGFAAIGGVYSRAVEHQFDQALKRMTTVCASRQPDYYHIFTKGAPEHVLELCQQIHLHGQDLPLDTDRKQIIRQAITDLARRGLRVIALADRLEHNGHALNRTEAEANLIFVGLFGIMDPPREDVAPAVHQLQQAGIRTVMVTGDNPVTAYAIAQSVGIIDGEIPYEQAIITGDELRELGNPTPDLLHRLQTVRVFARVSPQHKAEIVRMMQAAGFIVGMTGDGVNDAIALQKSDVGFAMGNGTDVAREASAVVLTNSRFSTIPAAVEEGRNVLHRIRLYLSYILSGNGCEVGAFVVAYLLGLPIPLTALVLLVINFATDSFPALAMAFEAGEENVMTRQPRKRSEPFITRIMWTHIGVQTVVATLVIMAVYYLCYQYWGLPLEVARAAAFMTYISQKLYRAFTARSMTRNLWEIGVFHNRWTIGAVGISLAIALFFVYTPVINSAMGMAALDLSLLALIAVVGLLPPVAEEITKLFLQRTEALLCTRPVGDHGLQPFATQSETAAS